MPIAFSNDETGGSMHKLKGKRVAILVADGFEESEFLEPKRRLEEEGAKVDVISLASDKVRSTRGHDWAQDFSVDVALADADHRKYNSLMLPGGVYNPDTLRGNEMALEFVKAFFSGKKQRPVAAICHAPQILISADLVRGRTMTSFSSIRKDLENAGANWVDKEVVVDQGLVTSRSPKDIEAFNQQMIEEFCEGTHRL